jgi:hypothetical protein
MDTTTDHSDLESCMAELLGRRFGDGTLYLAPDSRGDLINIAIELGFLSADGYLTRKGRALVTRLGI